MEHFDKLIKLTEDDKVELASSLKESLGKDFVLGQTRFVCRYGTLSDGHEKLTAAQKYYQSVKEMWYIRSNMVNMKATAMESQADYLEWQEKLNSAVTPADKIRAEGKMLRAQEQMLQSLTTVEDQMRMLDEYNRIRLELKDQVESQYPLGIEQSEQDNWKAVYEYRMIKSSTPGFAPERTDNVPLPPQLKAELGVAYGRPDSYAGLIVDNKELAQLSGGDINKLIGFTKGEALEDKTGTGE